MQDLLAYMDPKFSMFILFTRVSVSCHNRRVSACHAARTNPSCARKQAELFRYWIAKVAMWRLESAGL